ncbi:hypothetical protein VDGL01_11508 [Verticillium dahliae]
MFSFLAVLWVAVLLGEGGGGAIGWIRRTLPERSSTMNVRLP